MSQLEPKFNLKQSLVVVQDKINYRRKRIYGLRADGYSNRKIAAKLGYSLSTVEKDIHSLREKLGINSGGCY